MILHTTKAGLTHTRNTHQEQKPNFYTIALPKFYPQLTTERRKHEHFVAPSVLRVVRILYKASSDRQPALDPPPVPSDHQYPALHATHAARRPPRRSVAFHRHSRPSQLVEIQCVDVVETAPRLDVAAAAERVNCAVDDGATRVDARGRDVGLCLRLGSLFVPAACVGIEAPDVASVGEFYGRSLSVVRLHAAPDEEVVAVECRLVAKATLGCAVGVS